MAEAPWSDLRGKPLNERGLATRLRQYGIKPKVIRIGDSTPRGYARESFHDAWQAYLAPPLAETSATSATSETDGKNPSRFNAKNVADTGKSSATDPHTSATSPADVADSTSNVADDVADMREKNTRKNNIVADVAFVALLPATQADKRNGGGVCALCGRPGGTECAYDGVTIRLHPQCQRSWIAAYEASRNRPAIAVGSSL